jgi:hypothetical protein
MKSGIRKSKASGSTKRRVFEILNRCGHYSPTQLSKREERKRYQG